MAVSKGGTLTLDEAWRPLEAALLEVDAVISGRLTVVSTERLRDSMRWYTFVYELAAHHHEMALKLYQRLTKWVPEYLNRTFVPGLRENSTRGGEQMVRYIAKSFDNYKVFMKFGRLALSYLDRYITKQTRTLVSGQRMQNDDITTVYLKAFNEVAFNAVRRDLLPFVLKQVNSRREGEAVDMALIRAAIELFTKVGTTGLTQDEQANFLDVEFDRPYVQSLKEWYSRKGIEEFEREGGHLTYLEWVSKRMTLEQQFVGDFLSQKSTTTNVVRGAVVDRLLTPLYARIIEHPHSGFGVSMTVEGRKDRAVVMYALLCLVPEGQAVTHIAREFGKVQLELLVAAVREFETASPDAAADGGVDKSPEKVLVERLMQIHRDAINFITCCDNSPQLVFSLKRTFEDRLKRPLSKREKGPPAAPGATAADVVKEVNFAEVLASYVDGLMRREFKELDQDAESDRIDDVLTIFNYVGDKDVFQLAHQQRLAKRLLGSGSSQHEDLERTLLTRLQRTMGKSYSFKLEGMLHDWESTKQTAADFTAQFGKTLPAEITVSVLTAGNWPAFRTDSFAATGTLKVCIESFSRHYRKLCPVRKLAWINTLGSATVNITFAKGVKEGQATLYQGAILEALQERSGMSVAALATYLQLDGKLIKPQLAPMYLAKLFQILNRVDPATGQVLPPSGKTIGDEDCFALNPEFTHKMRRFKLPTANTAGPSSSTVTDAAIDESRRYTVDACIVRIMKSRRTLPYRDLQSTVIEQLTKYFLPQPKLIKSRVEDLIVRQYLKRDEEDATTFHYLA